MVKNLFIARKTCRPWKGVGMFIIKKKYLYIFERPVSSGSCQILNARKIFKRGNVNGKKVEEWRKGEGKKQTPPQKPLRGVVVVMSRWLETNYIQSNK